MNLKKIILCCAITAPMLWGTACDDPATDMIQPTGEAQHTSETVGGQGEEIDPDDPD